MKRLITDFWRKNKYFISAVVFVVLLLAIWEITVRVRGTEEYVLPAFSVVVKELCLLFKKAEFYTQLWGTLKRIFSALAFSIILGVILGVLSGLNGYIKACLKPVIACIKSVPVMAITLIILLNFGKSKTPSIIGFLMAFPIVYTHVVFGVENIDKKLLEMAKVYKIGKKDKLLKVQLPQVLPSLFAGIETAGGLCIKAVISAEILCYTVKSLGLAMYIAKSNMFEDTPILFAYCLVAILLSLVFEGLLKLLQKAVIKWK